MAKKIDLRAEKRARNEEYALKHQKRQSEIQLEADKALKRRGGKWGSWCGTPGHPPECNCVY